MDTAAIFPCFKGSGRHIGFHCTLVMQTVKSWNGSYVTAYQLLLTQRAKIAGS